MSKAWMPLYVGDYLADTQHLTTLQHGAYLLLIMSYWQHGGLPNDEEAIARISRLNRDQWRSNCLAIASMFETGWKHKRIEAELRKAKVISEKRAVLGAIGGRSNRGRSNGMRHLIAAQHQAIAKQTVAQSQSQLKERGNGEKKEGAGDRGKLNITSGLEAIVKARGWA